MKHWIASAVAALETSLGVVPHELNELDWVDEQTSTLHGISQNESESIIGQWANLGRDTLEPPVTLDHAKREEQIALELKKATENEDEYPRASQVIRFEANARYDPFI